MATPEELWRNAEAECQQRLYEELAEQQRQRAAQEADAQCRAAIEDRARAFKNLADGYGNACGD